ncbi:DNA-protecting protein DprA [Patescibacteria group bacterium]|nr:DNA-protecting protein DprA [Patescibacteria group bacterium]
MQKITIKDKNYPQLLKQIYDPPKQLYILGKLEKLEKYPLAVVGTRKVSSYGRQVTEQFVRTLGRKGLTIISGLALGVDGLAHQAALDVKAKTIAVLGSGFDNIYPATHKKLAQDIVESGGAVITEYPPEMPPSKITFPSRNRIISGLSLGVLIIDAPERSGALITARTALEQGRDVFAVPGQIDDRNFVGTNELIKKGAAMVTKPEDVLEELGLSDILTTDYRVGPCSEEEEILLGCLNKNPVHIDQLVKQAKLEVAKLISLLITMEISGMVKNLGDGYYIRK